jgi:Flp pilus assembly pilin Flp
VRVLRTLRRAAGRFLREESGATALEYAVLLAFLLMTCIAAVNAFRAPAGSALESSGTSIGTYADP